jgi:hypothetical protein
MNEHHKQPGNMCRFPKENNDINRNIDPTINNEKKGPMMSVTTASPQSQSMYRTRIESTYSIS